MNDLWFPFLVALLAPALAWAFLGLHLLLRGSPTERTVQWLTSGSLLVATLGALIGGARLVLGAGLEPLRIGALVTAPRYHLELGFDLDLLSAGFLLLTFTLTGLVGAFSARYLHREPGFSRFFFLLLTMCLGFELVAAGWGLDLLFLGWELVGLSSALLIAFFSRRQAPLENGLRAYTIYRFADLALLLSVVLVHHLMGSVRWTDLSTTPIAAGGTTTLCALLLVFAAMGKAGSVPFSGWLPRAMEGPTSSSAIFYGALSIHAGPFLLLKAWPLLEAAPAARVVLGLIGLLSAIHGSMVGRVQTDVKSTQGYAAIAQVGLIFIEIALGWTELAALHGLGHAIFRANQLLRAPSVLAERDRLTVLLGDARPSRNIEAAFPPGLQRFLYRFAMERWFLDEAMEGWLIRPFRRMLCNLDRIDRAWVNLLSGGIAPRQPIEEPTVEGRVEGLPLRRPRRSLSQAEMVIPTPRAEETRR